MTTRIQALTVILHGDIREDEVQWIVDAIKMIRGVHDVGLVATTAESYLARKRVTGELHLAIRKAIDDVFKGARK